MGWGYGGSGAGGLGGGGTQGVWIQSGKADQDQPHGLCMTAPDRCYCLFEPSLLNNTRWG